MKYLLFMLVALTGYGTIACNANCDGSYSVSDKFTEQQKLAIIQGAARVNKFTEKNSIVLSPDGMCEIIPETVEGHGGEYLHFDGTIKLDSQKIGHSMSLFERIAAHEMLHSLGLEHVSYGMMAQKVNELTEFTYQDYHECRRVGACEPLPLPYRKNSEMRGK